MLKLEKELINKIADAAHDWNDKYIARFAAWDALDDIHDNAADYLFKDAQKLYYDTYIAMDRAEIALDKAIDAYNEYMRAEV